MRRFRPYLHYLKMVRGPLTTAIFCGLLYGVSSGAGLPALVKYIFPAIFSHKADGLSLGTVALIASASRWCFSCGRSAATSTAITSS